MQRPEGMLGLRQFPELLSGEVGPLRRWIAEPRADRAASSLAVIVVGAGLYGAAMGCWRAPLQALYVGIKFPLIILLVASGNALLNAMLAPLLGLNIGLRQAFLAILASFNIAAAILGSFSPLAAFAVWNSPPMSPDIRLSGGAYSFIMVGHVAVIAFAGVAANLRLYGMLRSLSPSRAVSIRVLLAWLAGNLFFGSQLCWILRPFIGSPTLPVQFLRETAFQGNFYETVFRSFLRGFNLN
jgi:hypothetical protein